MTELVNKLNALVWGAPALILILGVGLYLTLQLKAAQITLFPAALKSFSAKLFSGQRDDGVSAFQALCTALAATVGTGNLAGVAGAVCLGGPGTIFWMWVCGILGMVTKFAEATLAVHFREKTETGFRGGPMYTITRGLGSKWRPMASAYCIFGVIAAFGVGNATQINAAITGINTVLYHAGISPTQHGNFFMGLIFAGIIGILLFGGAKRIGSAAAYLVPFAAGGYILMCTGVLITRLDQIPEAFSQILEGAFSPRAVTGGVLGSAFQTLRIGCSRGVFTNEAGMGTASIAHAAAQVNHPVQQGLMGIVEVFLDTIVICTLTALVILVSGVPIPYGEDTGVELTAQAFTAIYGETASVAIAAALVLFAVATVLGWGLYGARCAEFLFGPVSWNIFAMAQTAMVVLASLLDTSLLWQFADMVNGLMVIPNLITLAALTPVLVRLTKEYKKSGDRITGGGYYADFHQCKPL